jgi:hypothetical protein
MSHVCSFCDKCFIKKGNLERHISSTHNEKKYECKHCNKIYLHHQSLYRHMKNCKQNIEKNNEVVKYEMDELKNKLINEQSIITKEQYEQLIKVIQNDVKDKAPIVINIQNNNNNIQNITNNTTNTVTNNIDKFHMDVFLNETCKDAINMSEFMKSIEPTYNDIQNCHQDGIVTTISNTVVSRLKDLELEKRPIHCSDKKRKTLYIKDNDNWNKDINHELIRKIIDEISYKQVRALQDWMRTTHEQMSSEEYTNKLMEITRSLTDDLSLNRCYTKIIGNISESVFI